MKKYCVTTTSIVNAEVQVWAQDEKEAAAKVCGWEGDVSNSNGQGWTREYYLGDDLISERVYYDYDCECAPGVVVNVAEIEPRPSEEIPYPTYRIATPMGKNVEELEKAEWGLVLEEECQELLAVLQSRK